MSGPNQPSTVMSYIDSGVAAVQSAVGSLTGELSSLFSPWEDTHASSSSRITYNFPYEDLTDEDMTGNTADKTAADQRKAHAELENNASHVAVKAGPFNLSSSGAATIDNENRREGKSDQFVGSGKEFIGNAIGSDSLKREGREQNAQGQGQEAAGQVTDYASGVGTFIFLSCNVWVVNY